MADGQPNPAREYAETTAVIELLMAYVVGWDFGPEDAVQLAKEISDIYRCARHGFND